MKYEMYLEYQIKNQKVKKPYKYREGQRRAIDWFFADVPKHFSILDIGCGDGTGLVYLKQLGFTNVKGIDLHSTKIELARRRGVDAQVLDFMDYPEDEEFDVFWFSHSFEHMFDPVATIEKVYSLSYSYPEINIVVPYPDTGPKEIHTASDIIGTRVDDNSATFRQWLAHRGLHIVEYKYSNYREKEIWVQAVGPDLLGYE